MNYKDMPRDSGIYMIKNLVNGKMYIGQAQNIRNRIQQHLNSVKKENDNHLYRSIRKHGVDKFAVIILDTCGINLLDERENLWISQYNSTQRGYNICSIAKSARGVKRSKTQISRITGAHAPKSVTVYDSIEDRVIRSISINQAFKTINVRNRNLITFYKHGCMFVSRNRYLIMRGGVTLNRAKARYDNRIKDIAKARSELATGNGKRARRVVIKLDDNKNPLGRYESVSDAIRDLTGKPNLRGAGISVAIRNNWKCQGFYWKYEEETSA